MKHASVLSSVIALLFSPIVPASINLDSDGNVNLFGDVRLRAEYDDRERLDSVSQDRNRLRYRARLGLAYKANEHWSARMRLATNTSSINSPHVTFGDDPDIDFDQAYLSYKSGDMNITGGKQPLNYWQSSEMVWDLDFNPDALSYSQKLGDLRINAAHIIINDNSWGSTDDTIELLQGVYQAGDITTALAYFNVNDGSLAETVTTLAFQYKKPKWRAVVEVSSSDANVEDLAYALQYRQSFGEGKGFRIYYMHVEALSIPGDGSYGQDDFPDQNGAGLSNFEGFRLQYDQQLDNNVDMDVRLYSMEAIDAGFAAAASGSPTANAFFSDNDRLRLQLNINVKF